MGKGRTLEKDLLATLLVEAVYTTDKQVCEKYGVSLRSLQRARQQLAADPELASLVATKRAALDRDWAEVLTASLRTAIETVGTISIAMRQDQGMKANPIALEKVAGAAKILAEIHFTGRLLDARLPDTTGAQDRVPPPGDSDDEEPDYAN